MQVVPDGIQSVNGSNVTMGCTSPLVDRGGVMVCESLSHLVDGCSPDIDTSTSDWASQLVTVRKSITSAFPAQHVLLTFGFDTAVSLTAIELDLFLSLEWQIGAPYITVYANEDHDLVFNYSTYFLPLQSTILWLSCDFLSTVHMLIDSTRTASSFHTWHILVSQFSRSIQWVHVGDVRFIKSDVTPMTCTRTVSAATTSNFIPSEQDFVIIRATILF